MNIRIKNCNESMLIIALAGRFTSDTATQAEAELNDLLTAYPNRKVCLDFSEVEYISSAGLRCLLKIKKERQTDIFIIEVRNEVYDIFEMTGMLHIFSVRRKIREISLDGCEIIGTGANATVYRLDKDTIVKIYKPGTPFFMYDRECEIAQRAFLDGIPTAITYRNIVRCKDQYGILFEMIKSEPFTRLIRNEPQNFETYMRQYVDLLRELHSVDADPTFYPSCKQLYKKFITQSREWYTEEELQKLLYCVDSIPDCRKLVHGDFHAKNIMMSDGKLMLIDMISMSYGHPVFDLMSMTTIMYTLMVTNPDKVEAYNEIPGDLLQKIWNRFVELYFNVSGQEAIDQISHKLQRISMLRTAVMPAIANGLDRETLQHFVDVCRQHLLPYIEKIPEDIRTLDILSSDKA